MFLILALVISIALLGCHRNASVVDPASRGVRRPRPSFSLRYVQGTGSFFEPRMRTTYELNEKYLLVTFKYPKESRVTQSTISEEQLDLLWQKLSQLDLSTLAEPATELHNRCHVRETDQPYGALEIIADGNSITIVNDFDAKRCPEIQNFEHFIGELPALLGNPAPPPSKTK